MSETKKKEKRTIIVTNVSEDDCEYIEDTGIPLTVFVRKAIKEKRARDSK